MEGDVIEDEMVVELVIIQMEIDGAKVSIRYDKTADTGGARYGNAYEKQPGHSIHNPVTQDMLTINVGFQGNQFE